MISSSAPYGLKVASPVWRLLLRCKCHQRLKERERDWAKKICWKRSNQISLRFLFFKYFLFFVTNRWQIIGVSFEIKFPLSLSLSLSHFLLFRSNRFFVKRNFSIEKARRTGQYIRTILTQFFVGCWKYPYNTNTSTGLSITTVKLLVVIYSPWLHNKTVLNVMMSNTGS